MRERRSYCFYIMASRSKTLYCGVTGDLTKRVWQHKNHVYEGFTDKYNVERLVYYERYGRVIDAITRETQVKKWSRAKKIALIESVNPTWIDQAEDWGKPMKFSLGEVKGIGPFKCRFLGGDAPCERQRQPLTFWRILARNDTASIAGESRKCRFLRSDAATRAAKAAALVVCGILGRNDTTLIFLFCGILGRNDTV